MNSLIEKDITTQELFKAYRDVRQMSEKLCQPLQTEDYVVQPVDFVSPPKWNLAHVTWFFETFILKPYMPDYQEFNPNFGFFFNSYYESIGKRTFRAHRGNMTRPTTEEVYAYRRYVDKEIEKMVQENTEWNEEFVSLFELGLNHEQQHQELLLTDLKYILANNPIFPPYQQQPKSDSGKISFDLLSDEFLPIDEGIYTIGFEGNEFHFDNEKGVHQVFLHKYRFQNRLITNAEFIEFIEAGGYKQFEHWLSAGWEWVKTNQIDSPLYWHYLDGEWYQYTLQGLQKVHPHHPITHISFYEADAFARWRGKRLLTEFEWETACKLYAPKIDTQANFLEKGFFHPQFSLSSQFWGDVWEWTNSAYLPYPYYQQAKGALGEYNGKFMINQMVLRGGSCVTPLSHIRATYRNFFHPHERWQFTGLRLAEYC